MTRAELRDWISRVADTLHLDEEGIDKFTDMAIEIADKYVKPEYNEKAWFADFFLGAVIAASCQGEYTVTTEEV